MQRKISAASILSGIFIILLLAFALFPIWSMLRLALDGAIKSAPTEFHLLPEQFSLEVFGKMLGRPSQTLTFAGLIRNSLLVAIGAAGLSIVFGVSMAYAFARLRFPGRQSGLFALLVGALLPPVALMTPLYVLLSSLGIRTSLLGLVIVYTAFSIPFCIWNMRAAFQSVPLELEEAAFIDGATPFIAFRRIALPLAAPSIAVAAVVAFLAGYTEFAIGWLFVENSQNVTLAMAVWGLLGRATWSELAALSILMSLPVILIFLLLQNYLVDRLLIGINR